MTSRISSTPTSSHFTQHLETGPRYALILYRVYDIISLYSLKFIAMGSSMNVGLFLTI